MSEATIEFEPKEIIQIFFQQDSGRSVTDAEIEPLSPKELCEVAGLCAAELQVNVSTG